MQSRNRFLLTGCCAAIFLLLPACAKTELAKPVFAIGQKVSVGKLVYNVLEMDWKPELSGAKQLPKDRFLVLRLNITNSSGTERSVPLLRLIDGKGSAIAEFVEIEGNQQWLGLLRRLSPALTEDGMIVFDVPVGGYKLEVVDNAEAENEQIALIDIPASMDQQTPRR